LRISPNRVGFREIAAEDGDATDVTQFGSLPGRGREQG